MENLQTKLNGTVKQDAIVAIEAAELAFRAAADGLSDLKDALESDNKAATFAALLKIKGASFGIEVLGEIFDKIGA